MPTYHVHDCDKCTHIISRPIFGRLLDIYRNCNNPEEFIVRSGPDGEYGNVWVGHTDYVLCEFLEGLVAQGAPTYLRIGR